MANTLRTARTVAMLAAGFLSACGSQAKDAYTASNTPYASYELPTTGVVGTGVESEEELVPGNWLRVELGHVMLPNESGQPVPMPSSLFMLASSAGVNGYWSNSVLVTHWKACTARALGSPVAMVHSYR